MVTKSGVPGKRAVTVNTVPASGLGSVTNMLSPTAISPNPKDVGSIFPAAIVSVVLNHLFPLRPSAPVTPLMFPLGINAAVAPAVPGVPVTDRTVNNAPSSLLLARVSKTISLANNPVY